MKDLKNFRSAGVATLLLVESMVSRAQSCALCYTQAAAEKERFIEGLRNGIMVLIVPSFLVCTAMIVLAYRKRNAFNDGEQADYESW